MQFQVLFSRRSVDAVYLDGIIHDGPGPGRPATLVGQRPRQPVLDLVIPATLDAWADEVATIEVRGTSEKLELSHHDTRVSLAPYDTAA